MKFPAVTVMIIYSGLNLNYVVNRKCRNTEQSNTVKLKKYSIRNVA